MDKLDKWALMISSDVRIAIVNALAVSDYEDIKLGVEEILEREVSSGSLSWHMEKLQSAGIIEERAGIGSLTSVGREFYEKLSDVEREIKEVKLDVD